MADLISEFPGNYRKNDKKQRRVAFLKQNAHLFTFSPTPRCMRATSDPSAPLHARTIAASSAICAPDSSGPSDKRYDWQVWWRICCDRTTGYMWFLSSVYSVTPSKKLPSQGPYVTWPASRGARNAFLALGLSLVQGGALHRRQSWLRGKTPSPCSMQQSSPET